MTPIKKLRNLPIGALVKSTYVRCNALFNKRGREAATMLASSQVYKEVLNKAIQDDLERQTLTMFLSSINTTHDS